MVFIWTQDTPRSTWTKTALEPMSSHPQQAQHHTQEGKFGDAVWRVSWSVSGNVLAVSSGASMFFSFHFVPLSFSFNAD